MEERRQKNNDWCVADLHGRVRIKSSRLHCGVHGHENVSEWLKGALLKVLPFLYFFFNRNYESFAVRTRMKSCLIYFLFFMRCWFSFFFWYVLFLWIPNDVFINRKRMILLYLNPQASVILRSLSFFLKIGAFFFFLNTCIFVNVGVFWCLCDHPLSSSLCTSCLKPSLPTQLLFLEFSFYPPSSPSWVDAVLILVCSGSLLSM